MGMTMIKIRGTRGARHHVPVHILAILALILLAVSVILASIALVRPGWVHTAQGPFSIEAGFFETCFKDPATYRCVEFSDTDLEFGAGFEDGHGPCHKLRATKYVDYVAILFLCLTVLACFPAACLPGPAGVSSARIATLLCFVSLVLCTTVLGMMLSILNDLNDRWDTRILSGVPYAVDYCFAMGVSATIMAGVALLCLLKTSLESRPIIVADPKTVVYETEETITTTVNREM